MNIIVSYQLGRQMYGSSPFLNTEEMIFGHFSSQRTERELGASEVRLGEGTEHSLRYTSILTFCYKHKL